MRGLTRSRTSPFSCRPPPSAPRKRGAQLYLAKPARRPHAGEESHSGFQGWAGGVRGMFRHTYPPLAAIKTQWRCLYTLRESKSGDSTGETAQKQHVGGQENREGPSGRWDGSPHTPRLPLAPAPAAPHWSTSPRSSRAGIVTCVARVGGLPNCTVAI